MRTLLIHAIVNTNLGGGWVRRPEEIHIGFHSMIKL